MFDVFKVYMIDMIYIVKEPFVHLTALISLRGTLKVPFLYIFMLKKLTSSLRNFIVFGTKKNK